jgi:hypothetical protein
VLDGDGCCEEGWGEINPSKEPGLSRDILVARTVVDIGKPIFAVRVLKMSDDERIVRVGTDVASCEIIDSVIVVGKTSGGNSLFPVGGRSLLNFRQNFQISDNPPPPHLHSKRMFLSLL